MQIGEENQGVPSYNKTLPILSFLRSVCDYAWYANWDNMHYIDCNHIYILYISC